MVKKQKGPPNDSITQASVMLALMGGKTKIAKKYKAKIKKLQAELKQTRSQLKKVKKQNKKLLQNKTQKKKSHNMPQRRKRQLKWIYTQSRRANKQTRRSRR